MLIEFTVGNYRSFKDTVTLSMVAANLVSQDKSVDENNVFAVDKKLSLLKSAAIYGANASGKSNLAKALPVLMLCIAHLATVAAEVPSDAGSPVPLGFRAASAVPAGTKSAAPRTSPKAAVRTAFIVASSSMMPVVDTGPTT